jgi:4-amino-4-deoxy-L-arabinose transferase-like glycosyltransferase
MSLNINRVFNQKYYLYYIVFAAIIVRIIFSFGHIFSDDAYFDYLSYTFYTGEFAKDYIGYPHTPLRILVFALTALAFSIFGTNEFATMVFPMIFSIGNILLAYFFAKEITKSENTGLIAALLMAFLPTDITFATINFSDSPSAFFVNSGLFFLYKSHQKESLKFSIISGICFFMSIQFKVNIFFIGLLLAIFWIFIVFKSKSFSYYIPVALSFVGLNLLIEGLIYWNLQGDFFYRFSQIELNSVYNLNEFFALGSSRGYLTESGFWPAVFDRVFILNPKAVFLRRFYLFLPLIALYQSYIFLKEKKHIWLVYWFMGLSVLFIGFTSSFTHYQPIIQRLSWYMFPLFLPAVLLSTFFITRFKNKIKLILIVLYLFGSIIMTYSYTNYFNVKELNALKSYLKSNSERIIYTDHFTKYSVDLIDGYPNPLRTKRISSSEFNIDKINQGEWLLYKFEHVNELKEQEHTFPDFTILQSNKFLKIFESGGFILYEKVSD